MGDIRRDKSWRDFSTIRIFKWFAICIFYGHCLSSIAWISDWKGNKMTTQTKALKLALEALENSIDLVSNEAREAESLYGKYPSRIARIQGLVALEVAHEKAITASKEALAQPEQEPVAWMYESVCGNDFATRHCAPSYAKNIRPLYTTPPQRTWVGLTDEDKAFCVQATVKRGSTYELIAAIEAKLKEKNTK